MTKQLGKNTVVLPTKVFKIAKLFWDFGTVVFGNLYFYDF